MKRERKQLESRRMEMNLIFKALTSLNMFKASYVVEFIERQYGVTPQTVYLAVRKCEERPHAIVWHETTLTYRIFYDRQGNPRPINPYAMDLLSPETDLSHFFKPD
jgi:hypothetical protein